MIMGWIFAGITLSAVILATFVFNMRHAILALWAAGLGVGAIYLTLGAEFLAIIQCVISTLVTISFVFFAVMFGEYAQEPKTSQTIRGKFRGDFFLTILSIVLGGAFAAVIWMGTQTIPEAPVAIETQTVAQVPTSDLLALGQKLTQENLLSLEVLALVLFLVLVGGGVVARSEKEEQS